MITWSQTITVKRAEHGEFVKGEYRKGDFEEFSICANVQPHDFRQLARESQGRRIRDAIKIYSQERLIPQDDCNVADKIYWEGKVYEVFQVKNYHQFGDLIHYKSIALLMNMEDQKEENNESTVE